MFKFQRRDFFSVLMILRQFFSRGTEYYYDKFQCGMERNMVIKNVQIYYNILREREVFQISVCREQKNFSFTF